MEIVMKIINIKGLLLSLLIFGCGTSTNTYQQAKLPVPDDAYFYDICNLSFYDSKLCMTKVGENIEREKTRRIAQLKELDIYFKNQGAANYLEIAYISYPAVNALGQDVPYNLFKLGIINKVGGDTVLQFFATDYNYPIVWTAPKNLNTRTIKIGTSMDQFFKCAAFYQFDKLNKEAYFVVDLECDK